MHERLAIGCGSPLFPDANAGQDQCIEAIPSAPLTAACDPLRSLMLASSSVRLSALCGALHNRPLQPVHPDASTAGIELSPVISARIIPNGSFPATRLRVLHCWYLFSMQYFLHKMLHLGFERARAKSVGLC
jgi:hypothetical protein